MHTIKKAIIFVISILLVFSSGCGLIASMSVVDGLMITEVVSSNAQSLSHDVLGNPDWIEVRNNSGDTINLLGYTIVEADKNQYKFPDINLEAGGYLILYCCKPIGDEATAAMCTDFKLSKSGTNLKLMWQSGTVQDVDVPELATDVSYGVDNNGSHSYFTNATPGAANDANTYETLEALEVSEAATLYITEVMPRALAADEAGWVEIYNAGDKSVALKNFFITDSPSNAEKARLPDIELAAGAYTVVRFTDQTGEDTVPFKIGRDETTLTLYSRFGKETDAIAWNAGILAGFSAGRTAQDGVVFFAQPTPGQANSEEFFVQIAIAEGICDVRINEVLRRNTFSIIDEDGLRSPWVELYNASDSAVSLGEYSLSDDADEPIAWQLPDISLQPKAYIIVYLTGKDSASTDGELHTNFRLGADEHLYLTNLLEGTQQTVTMGEGKDNVSYGLDGSGQWMFFPQSTPLAANDTKGFAEITAIPGQGSQGLSINEVVAVASARSGDNDWIELYNATEQEIDLEGYCLSDTRNDLGKWPIAQKTIESNGYAVIDAYQNGEAQDVLSIALSGETLYLTEPKGTVIDQFDTGVLRPGLSRGVTAGNTVALLAAPTPGKPNSTETIGGICGAPFFSVHGGYQDDPITLEIRQPTDGATIFYTLDGSTPTSSSVQYTTPITISETTAVRAVSIKEGMLQSDETVATYLYVEEKHTLPVVCLSMTQKDLNYVFGSEERQNVRERAGYVEYYEADGTLGVRFPAGFKIAGAGTRMYPQRSINLYLRGAYGMSEVVYPFFENYEVTAFQSLSLRNMGQDTSLTRMRDAYCMMAVNGLNIDNMQTKFAVVYINGKYWGLYEFKENQNEDYYASKYGIDPDDMEMVRANTYAYVGNSRNIKSLFNTALGNTNNADRFASYTERADADYFMDYVVAQCFCCNSDWYNQKYAHSTDDVVKWRPMFFDLDWGFMSSPDSRLIGMFFRSEPIEIGQGMTDENGEVMLDENGEIVYNTVDMNLFYGFYKNREWRDQFIERYAEVLNTVFTQERLLMLFDEMVASIEGEMPRTIERWHWPSSMEKWEREIATMRERIAARPEGAKNALQTHFSLSDERMAELFPNG